MICPEPALETSECVVTEPLAEIFAVFVKGELTEVEWFRNFDGTNFDDLIVKEVMVYVRDPIGFVDHRITTRIWYYEDGTASPDVKVTIKYYPSKLDKFRESSKKRSNNVKLLQGNVMDMIVETAGLADPMQAIGLGVMFMDSLSAQISMYEREGSPAFAQAVAADTTNTWLEGQPSALGGTTIREYILEQLT